MPVQNYRDLEVWQVAMDLVTVIYEETRRLPAEERFGLTNQVRRAAVSIPSNIAEGQGRRTTREFLNYLSIARGSLQEVETQIEIARRLDYLPAAALERLRPLCQSAVRLINGLINALERKA